MSSLARAWVANHATMAVVVGLILVATLVAAVARGVVDDRITNPLGDTYASLTVTLVLPVLVVTLLVVGWHDRLEPSLALPARRLLWVRALWWLLGVGVGCVVLCPVRSLVGTRQLAIDVGVLAGLSSLALCRFGLGPAIAVPLLVLLPHLARQSGAPPRWWTVLATTPASATGVVAVALSTAGLGAYTWWGPRSPTRLTGSGSAD